MTTIKWNRPHNGTSERRSFNSMPALFDSFLNPYVSSQKLMNDFFSGMNGTMPAVNITENADNINIVMVAPGMKREDFIIKMEDNQLTVSYKKEQEKTESTDTFFKKRV